MKLGILTPFIGNFGEKGFYNVQEIGLTKELSKLFDDVIIYKAVSLSAGKVTSAIEGCDNAVLHQIPVKNQGINAIWDCSVMDAAIDALLFFSDTQLCVPNVYKWCRSNNVKMFPYIGVIESHSTSNIKKVIIDGLFGRNLKVYKNCICFVKTPIVGEKLKELGVNNCIVAPVGLDLTLMHKDFDATDTAMLKHKYGFEDTDKVLLFIGRMTEEKHPGMMVELLQKLYKKDGAYRLLMVGKGELKADVELAANEINREVDKRIIHMIDQIPNKDIWELYCLSDCFVNLNQQEIFGMAILEAMYYGCKVVAWHAPGPDFIIDDQETGYLVNSEEELQDCIENGVINSELVSRYIVENFTWEASAKLIYQQISNAVVPEAIRGGIRRSSLPLIPQLQMADECCLYYAGRLCTEGQVAA